MWPDPNAEKLPDSYQASIKRRFLAEIQHIADYGEPAESFNYLQDGIWEIKVSSLRVSFYDTDGRGNFDPKVSEPFTNYQGKNEYPFPDDFEDYLRVGHYFGKDRQKTSQHDLMMCTQVREEDLEQDRDAADSNSDPAGGIH